MDNGRQPWNVAGPQTGCTVREEDFLGSIYANQAVLRLPGRWMEKGSLALGTAFDRQKLNGERKTLVLVSGLRTD